MSTSNTFTFALNVPQAIQQAYGICGFTPETVETPDLVYARVALNLIFSEWTSRGNFLFTVDNQVINLPIGTGNPNNPIVLPVGTVDVYDASLRDNSSGFPLDVPLLERIGRSQYQALPDKTVLDLPVMYFIDRVTPPLMYLYHPPNIGTYQLTYWRVVQIQDVATTSAQESPAVPYRWQMPVVRALAVEIALYKNKPPAFVQMLGQIYEQAYEMAGAGERDRAPLRLDVDLTSLRRRR